MEQRLLLRTNGSCNSYVPSCSLVSSSWVSDKLLIAQPWLSAGLLCFCRESQNMQCCTHPMMVNSSISEFTYTHAHTPARNLAYNVKRNTKKSLISNFTCYRFLKEFSSYLGFESFCLECPLFVQTLAFLPALSASSRASAGEGLLGSPWVLASDTLLRLLL